MAKNKKLPLLDQSDLTSTNDPSYNSNLEGRSFQNFEGNNGSTNMGRKKATGTEEIHEENEKTQEAKEAVENQIHTESNGEENLSNTEMVRRSVNFLGENCSVADVIKHVQETYGVELKQATAQNYTSLAKRQLRGGEPARRGRQAVMESTEPTITDLLTLKEVADETKDGIQGLSDQLTQLETIANRVGGFGKLRKTLDALNRLSEK